MNALPAMSAGRLRLGLALAAALVATAACGAGQQAQTSAERSTIQGANVQVQDLKIRGLQLETPQGDSYASGTAVPLIGVFVNNARSHDALTSVSSPMFTGWGEQSHISAPGSIQPLADASSSSAPTGTPVLTQHVGIDSGDAVSFGVPDATSQLLLTGLKKTLFPGTSVPITFTFAHAGSVTATVPVATSGS